MRWPELAFVALTALVGATVAACGARRGAGAPPSGPATATGEVWAENLAAHGDPARATRLVGRRWARRLGGASDDPPGLSFEKATGGRARMSLRVSPKP